MKRRRHHTTNKGHAIARIRGAAKSASHELHKAGLRHSAHALKVIGGATAAIGKHTPGNWAADMGAGMRAAPLSGGHKPRRKRAKKASAGRKVHRGHRKGAKRRGGLSKLSAKQLRAFRKMQAAARRGRGHHKRKAARRRR